MFKIGELSRLCCIPVKTLRYYDSEGLLVPDEIDQFTGYRYYSAARLADCNRIVSLKELGFTLEEIKQHLKANTDEQILELVEKKCLELEEKSHEISDRLQRLKHIKEAFSKNENSVFHITIRSGDTIHVAFKRKVYTVKSNAEAMIEQMKSDLPKSLTDKRTMIVNYEIEYRESDLDLAACVEIKGRLSATSEYEQKTIVFSGETATIVCKQDELNDAYKAILSHLHEFDYQIMGASYEIYYEDGTIELKIPVYKKVKCMDQPVEMQPFENDESAVGKWKIIDIVQNKEQFLYGHKKCPDADNSVWSELYFPEGGKPYRFLKGWTKGFLYLEATIPAPPHLVAIPYSIESLNGHTIMFLEIPRRYADGSKDLVPRLLVFEKELTNTDAVKETISF